MKNVVGIVPAYRPDFKLSETVHAIVEADFLEHIVIVDDGSGASYDDIFNGLSIDNNVTVLHLAVNSGTGGAIKYGLQYVLYHYPDCKGVVTFDADGQHAPDDVKKIVECFTEMPDKTVLGVRDFYSPEINIPLRSRFGNRMTELVFYAFTGVKLPDTQTGLRCYPRKIAEMVTQLLHSRYEFQLEALMLAVDKSALEQVKIKTIYEDNNKRSHFNPVLDSIRIYMVFFRFIGASLFCSVLDYAIFSLLFLLHGTVLSSLVISRVISVMVNFVINRQKVFNGKGHFFTQGVKFLLLAVLLFAGSYLGISFARKYLGWSPLFSKIVVEVGMFIVSFLAQRVWIFARQDR
ncbi:MAG: bifunctional glycosyltransferase family 2/GtrA family protein [Lentisphaeria bacterium]|nr:bifunctional glycosyltransferase family 2/GtrA family protein [Lentisphaeria bacterium]